MPVKFSFGLSQSGFELVYISTGEDSFVNKKTITVDLKGD